MSWTCDSCGEPINTPKEGYVEWLVRANNQEPQRFIGRDLQLVHHAVASPRAPRGDCYHDEDLQHKRDGSTSRNSSLDRFIGPDGLMQLLLLLHEGELPKDEVIEMIQRIHIPGYEQARPYFARALSEDVFHPNTPEGFYWQSEINAVLKWLKQQS